jgi:phosphoglycolate phosphatase-like HAD superfamily hydrolase
LIDAGGKIAWESVRGVIFDLDGTLYDQRRLRARILAELVMHLALQPSHWVDVVGLIRFRKLRERLADLKARNAAQLQYALVSKSLGLPESRVVAFVDEWIERRPLPHLRATRLSGVVEFFAILRAALRDQRTM